MAELRRGIDGNTVPVDEMEANYGRTLASIDEFAEELLDETYQLLATDNRLTKIVGEYRSVVGYGEVAIRLADVLAPTAIYVAP